MMRPCAAALRLRTGRAHPAHAAAAKFAHLALHTVVETGCAVTASDWQAAGGQFSTCGRTARSDPQSMQRTQTLFTLILDEPELMPRTQEREKRIPLNKKGASSDRLK